METSGRYIEMKTPEQLAEEAVESVWYSFGGGFHEIKEAVVKAIEADRAQHGKEYTCFKNSGKLD